MSAPPTTHISSIPSTVRSERDRIIAPGAENVGQAQIVPELSKPFALSGLFGVAECDAFVTELDDGEGSVMVIEQDELIEDSTRDQAM